MNGKPAFTRLLAHAVQQRGFLAFKRLDNTIPPGRVIIAIEGAAHLTYSRAGQFLVATSRDFFGFDVGASGMDSGMAATNGTTATGGRRSGFNARGFTGGATSGTVSGRRLRRMMGNKPFMV